jgi:MFS superfamily sulfate permease-like transporter
MSREEEKDSRVSSLPRLSEFVPPDAEESDEDLRVFDASVKHQVRSRLQPVENYFSDVRDFFVESPPKMASYVADSYRYYRSNTAALRKEILSGITVSVLQVPESVAFSYVAGVPPLYGLYATVFLSIITGAIGGRPAMISGAAGALAVIATNLTSAVGPLGDLPIETRRDHLLLCIIVVGVMQMLAAFFQLAKFVRLIPETAMVGFMNGLAIIIFMAQLTAFQYCPTSDTFTDCSQLEYEWMPLNNGEVYYVLIIVAVTMTVMHLYPKIPRVGKWLPASLVALIIATGIEWGIYRAAFNNVRTRTVGDTAPIGGGWPVAYLPPTDENTRWGVIFEYAFWQAATGLIESVMTLQAVDEIVNDSPSEFRSNQECFAQGLSNFVCGFFSAMGGDAMIGQSTINAMNGARGRMSTILSGVSMLIIILVASPIINFVPVAALTGVLFMVVIHTFNWDTFRLVFRVQVADAFAIILVTLLAVFTNLAVAVLAGAAWNSLVNSYQNGRLVNISKEEKYDERYNSDVVVYSVEGPLFFGSVKTFTTSFDPVDDLDYVICDFSNSYVSDFSAVAAIKQVSSRYHDNGKHFILRGISKFSTKQIRRTKNYIVDLLVMSAEDEEPKPKLRRQSSASVSMTRESLRIFNVEEYDSEIDENETPMRALADMANDGAIEVEASFSEVTEEEDESSRRKEE